MFSTFSLAKTYLGSGWAIHPLSGSLLKTSVEKIGSFCSDKLPEHVKIAQKLCDEPYKLNPPLDFENEQIHAIGSSITSNQLIFEKFEKLKRWRALNFYAAVLYAGIPTISFENSSQAFTKLNSLPNSDTRDTCLEKCLAVAKCSASFRKKGVLFIGAHLPLQAMHAWIIEDGYQPDEADRQWINFLPLMAITNNDAVF